MLKAQWEKVVQELFDTQEIPEVNEQRLKTFREYLGNTLKHPCYLFTANDDSISFEPLLLLYCLEEVDENKGIYVYVKRDSDKKNLVVPLTELQCPVEDGSNHILIDSFCSWFIHASYRKLCVQID